MRSPPIRARPLSLLLVVMSSCSEPTGTVTEAGSGGSSSGGSKSAAPGGTSGVPGATVAGGGGAVGGGGGATISGASHGGAMAGAATGGTATGGSASHGSPTGGTATGGSASSGSAASDACENVASDYAAELAQQLQCDPKDPSPCTDRVRAAPGCECRVFIEPADPFAIEHLSNVASGWFDADCSNPVCPEKCSTAQAGTCQADANSPRGGRCVTP